MDELQLFVSLRALGGAEFNPEALRAVQAELARLEQELAAGGEAPKPFSLSEEELRILSEMTARQRLEPEGKILRLAPLRWCYNLARRLLLGTQRRFNESVTYLIRRRYATVLLTRYYQLRSLALGRQLRNPQSAIPNPQSPPPEPPP